MAISCLALNPYLSTVTHNYPDRSDRSPAVAGMFYPGAPSRIEETLEQWGVEQTDERQRWRAALIPHAGWVYSGQIAASVLRRIEMPSTIIVLCPKHRPGGAECAVAPCRRWLFPGGSVASDVALSERIVDHVSNFSFDELPHREEHAIEVQLPLLARFAPQSQLVGITIGRVELQQCEEMANELAESLRHQLDDVLLVISSDMHHFAADAENRRLDELALQALDQCDPHRLFDICHKHGITMCGMLPAVIVLTALRQLDALKQSVRIAYATSAEASGDTQRVVGYAGMLFS